MMWPVRIYMGRQQSKPNRLSSTVESFLFSPVPMVNFKGKNEKLKKIFKNMENQISLAFSLFLTCFLNFSPKVKIPAKKLPKYLTNRNTCKKTSKIPAK